MANVSDRVFPFTQLAVAALRPDTVRRDYWDSTLRGFGLRITPAGVRTWTVRYKVDGRLQRYTIGSGKMKLAAARKEAHDKIHGAGAGGDPGAEKQAARLEERRTVAALFKAYSESVDERRQAGEFKSWLTVKSSLERDMLPAWKHVAVTDLSVGDVTSLVTRKAIASKVGANRLQAHIRMMLQFGIESGWITANPAAGLKKRKEQPRERVLSGDELRALWLHLAADQPIVLQRGKTHVRVMAPATGETLRDLLRILILCGQRLGETSLAKWADLDRDFGAWRIPAGDAKSGRAHTVPLSSTAGGLLAARYARAKPDAAYVFPASARAKSGPALVWAKRAAKGISAALGFEFHAHDLRRTVATNLGELGIAGDVIGLVLNHAKAGVTGRVYNLSKQEHAKFEALSAWARRLDDIVHERTGKVIEMAAARAV